MRLLHGFGAAAGAFFCCMLYPHPTEADQIRFASHRDWQTWQLPGTVELSPQGAILPVKAQRDINATLNAQIFGGGIRHAGSNSRDAILVMDGDLATGWSPNPQDSAENWTIEVDLGRGVSARRVKLIFDPEGPVPDLFALLMSTGEHAVDEVDNPIDGTVIYRTRERFKENTRYEITYELDQPFHTPIQYIRLDLLTLAPDTRLLEVEVETLGDNMALGLLERGGDIESHVSRPLSEELLREADRIYALTSSHQMGILALGATVDLPGPALEHILGPLAGGDISDPIGLDVNGYRLCADEIEQGLEKILESL